MIAHPRRTRPRAIIAPPIRRGAGAPNDEHPLPERTPSPRLHLAGGGAVLRQAARRRRRRRDQDRAAGGRHRPPPGALPRRPSRRRAEPHPPLREREQAGHDAKPGFRSRARGLSPPREGERPAHRGHAAGDAGGDGTGLRRPGADQPRPHHALDHAVRSDGAAQRLESLQPEHDPRRRRGLAHAAGAGAAHVPRPRAGEDRRLRRRVLLRRDGGLRGDHRRLRPRRLRPGPAHRYVETGGPRHPRAHRDRHVGPERLRRDPGHPRHPLRRLRPMQGRPRRGPLPHRRQPLARVHEDARRPRMGAGPQVRHPGGALRARRRGQRVSLRLGQGPHQAGDLRPGTGARLPLRHLLRPLGDPRLRARAGPRLLRRATAPVPSRWHDQDSRDCPFSHRAIPTPSTGRRPELGEHTDEVLAEVAGYTGGEIARLRAGGAF